MTVLTKTTSRSANTANTDFCDRSQILDATKEDIAVKVNESNFQMEVDQNEEIFVTKMSKLAIQSWKCHIIRSANQDQARIAAQELLDHETVSIVNDWAMKFLPRKYRKSQTDWFGKQSLSWHISVAYRCLDAELKWQVYIHIIQSCTQGSTTVVAIMQDVLKAINTDYPGIKNAYFKQDNAACYQSCETKIASPLLKHSTGVNVAQVNFSDPQGGKGAADRLAATCKAYIRTFFINKGNDVTTAEQLKDAILSYGGIEGVHVTATYSVNKDGLFENPQKIKDISKLNNFSLTSKGIRAWQSYAIGNGKVLTLEEPTIGKMSLFYKRYI